MSASEDLPIVPITAVEVAALFCTCGCCDNAFLIEHEALDQEAGAVAPEHDFQECPECGTLFDAQTARFSALLTNKQEG
ncbi:hypothetical protein [Halodurantibacterium flavum]|uniref:Small CPxCG-related zinc finger protein n=1 Tax=Halodurantibacterium flavum TaxID=1382802 RepID=A0ABW4SAH9_9RHOB